MIWSDPFLPIPSSLPFPPPENDSCSLWKEVWFAWCFLMLRARIRRGFGGRSFLSFLRSLGIPPANILLLLLPWKSASTTYMS